MSTLTPIQSQDQEIQLTRDSTPLTTEKSSDKKIKIVQKGKYNQMFCSLQQQKMI